MSIFRRNLVPPLIHRGRVVDVNVNTYTMMVATEHASKALRVSFATPYQHPDNGEGIYFMPEVGSICWIVEPSDGGNAFVVGWCALENAFGDHRSRKATLNPGDIYLGTRDENHILLRRGGIIEIGASPLSQRLYIPMENLIRDMCGQYHLSTFGGDLSWNVKLPQTTAGGKAPTDLTLSVREFAGDAAPIATAQIGSHGEGKPTILSLVLRESGAKGATSTLTLTLAKSGDVDFETKGKVTWKVTGDVKVEAQNITLTAKGTAKLVGTAVAAIEGGVVTVSSKTGAVLVDAKGGMSVTTSGPGPAMKVGAGTTPALMASDLLLKWLEGHVHDVFAIGAKSGPPLHPVTQTPISGSPLKSSALKVS